MTGGCVADFYPRSPCGERLAGPSGPAILINFYPRSPCGERPHGVAGGWPDPDFYPRSPCGERRRAAESRSTAGLFLSTLSLRRATKTSLTLPCPLPFLSTLSLRRATTFNFHLAPLCTDFYPRSPCGERPELWTFLPLRAKFLSTLSLRRATHESADDMCR